jgi:hypothetical protein
VDEARDRHDLQGPLRGGGAGRPARGGGAGATFVPIAGASPPPSVGVPPPPSLPSSRAEEQGKPARALSDAGASRWAGSRRGAPARAREEEKGRGVQGVWIRRTTLMRREIRVLVRD